MAQGMVTTPNRLPYDRFRAYNTQIVVLLLLRRHKLRFNEKFKPSDRHQDEQDEDSLLLAFLRLKFR
jgi:hypothetical protein